MTYLQYHLFFNLPALLLLLWLVRGRLSRTFFKWTGVVGLIAFVATSPWDLWAVDQGIWGFDWDRVTRVSLTAFGQQWHLPAEEYAFFVIEVAIVSLLCLLFLPHPKPEREDPPGSSRP
ncbi:MAG: lycopene cyclase domain-containing protein [Verrucomicrobiota bacterium]